MPETSTLATFIAALLLLEISPGPDMMLVLARGFGQGPKIALWTVVGMIFVAGIVQVGMLVLGLASLLQANGAALAALKWVGAAYLIYLGLRLLLASRGSRALIRADSRQQSNWSAVREGTINSLTNPKSLLFMFAFLPQFVDPAAGPIWSQLLVLGTIQKLAGVVSLGFVAVAAGTVGRWLRRWPQLLVWQQRFTGAVMIALGMRLLMSGSASAPLPSARS